MRRPIYLVNRFPDLGVADSQIDSISKARDFGAEAGRGEQEESEDDE